MSRKKIAKAIDYLLCLPKSVFFNLYYLPFSQAIKLPVLICHRSSLRSLGGVVSVPKDAKFGKIKLGFGMVQISDNKYSRFIWSVERSGHVSLGNNIRIGTGSRLFVSGRLTVSDGANFSGEATIVCKKEISFGEKCLVSWQTLFMDTDMHDVINTAGETLNSDAAVVIGARVWVGARSTVLKGVSVDENSIVASGTHIVKSFPANSILGGNPAKIVGDMTDKSFIH